MDSVEMGHDDVEADAAAAVTGWLDLLARERARGFAGLAGSRLHAAVPVNEALVHELLGAGPVRVKDWSFGVRVLAGARVGIEVTRSVLGVPVRARTVLAIEHGREPGRLRLRYPASLLWRGIRDLAGRFARLPEGVSFAADAIVVDLPRVAAAAGWADVSEWLTDVRVEGPQDGLLIVELRAEVPAGHVRPATVPRARRATRRASRRIRPEAFLAHLVGARAEIELHVHDTLANDALAIARVEAARSHTNHPAGGARTVLSFVRDLSVHFEAGYLVAKADIEVPDPPAG